MPENQEAQEGSSQGRYNRGLLAGMVFFLVTTLGGAFYIGHQRQETRQLTEDYVRMSAQLSQTRTELDAMNSKLSSLETPPAPPEQAEAAKPQPAEKLHRKTSQRPRHKGAMRANVAPVEETQWGNMLTELAEHQKQINSTLQDLDKARTDLEGRISSTRDELNTSIARNHEELAALKKRGERDYFEFDLTKSKQFSRIGPLNLSLRKAQTKKLFCDLELIVDDSKIKKNHINLYEPLFLYPADYVQPLEVVINSIGKNQARGYVSVPKFRKSELTAATPQSTLPDQAAAVSLEHRAATNPQE